MRIKLHSPYIYLISQEQLQESAVEFKYECEELFFRGIIYPKNSI